MKKLVGYKDNIERLEFIERILIVNTIQPELTIQEQLSEIIYSPKDKVFLVGWEDIGFCMLEKAKGAGAELNVLEEGMFTISSIVNRVSFIRADSHYSHIDYKDSDFDSIYKLDIPKDERIADYGDNYKNLEMKKYLNDKQFIEIMQLDMEIVFGTDIPRIDADIILFDTHFIQTRKLATLSYEIKVLNKIIECMADYKYVIKPHPSDNISLKYRKDEKLCMDDGIPWEIRHIMNISVMPKRKVYLSLTPTGAILNDTAIWGADTVVIFLDKIYEEFGIYPVYKERLESFIGFAKREEIKVFRPESLLELKVILNNILVNKAGSDGIDNYEESDKELNCLGCSNTINENELLAAEYHELVKNIPESKNVGTILINKDNSWIEIGICEFLLNNDYERFVFRIEHDIWATYFDAADDRLYENYTDNEKFDLRWYIARGIIVKVKVKNVCFEDANGNIIGELSNQNMVYLNSSLEADGWYTFNDCDSLVDFSVDKQLLLRTKKIIINTDVLFDTSYIGMRNLRKRNCDELSSALKREIGARDRNISELQHHLESWVAIAGEKDKQLQDTVEQREAINKILIKEREEYAALLSKKDYEFEAIISNERKEADAKYAALEEQYADELAERDTKIQEFKAIIEDGINSKGIVGLLKYRKRLKSIVIRDREIL